MKDESPGKVEVIFNRSRCFEETKSFEVFDYKVDILTVSCTKNVDELFLIFFYICLLHNSKGGIQVRVSAREDEGLTQMSCVGVVLRAIQREAHGDIVSGQLKIS